MYLLWRQYIKSKSKKKDVSLKSIDKEFLKDLQIKNLSVDVNEEFERFSNDIKAKGRVYKDYRAAFRNWVKSPYVQKTDRIRVKMHEEKKAQKRREELEKPVEYASPEEIQEALSNVNKVKDKMEWTS